MTPAAEAGKMGAVSGAVEDVEKLARNGGGRGGPRPGIVRAQRDAILDLVRRGAPPTTAAVKCGVPRRTHEDWLARGRRDDGPEPCRRYAEDIERAIEEWKFASIQTVDLAGAEDWRAAMTLLERRFPKEFGQRKFVEGQVQIQPQPFVVWENYTPEQAEQLIELLRIGSPAQDDPVLSNTARPAVELVEGQATRVAE